MSMPDTDTYIAGDSTPRRSSFRRRAAIAAFATVCAALAVWALRRPHLPLRARAIGAELDLAAGEVTVDEAGRVFGAPSGTPLAVGSRVATGKGSRAPV